MTYIPGTAWVQDMKDKINKELTDLREMAAANGLKNVRFTVTHNEESVLIVLVEANGQPTCLNIIPEGKSLIEYTEDNNMIVNANLVFFAPEYIVRILRDGTVVRLRDASHETQDRIFKQIEGVYAEHQSNTIIKQLISISPSSRLNRSS